MKIAILGTRGIPNNYGGFEQFAEYLSEGLTEKGHEIYVYSPHNHNYQEKEWRGVKIIHCFDPEYKVGTAGQFIYDLNCILDSRKRGFDIILQLGYTSSSVWSFLFPKRSLVLTNMDGLEWKRTKYGKMTRKFLSYAEKLAVKKSDYLISDSLGIRKYLAGKYKVDSEFIPYGATVFDQPDETVLAAFPFRAYEYDLLIARLEPENSLETILDGYVGSARERILAVVGNNNTRYGEYLKNRYVSVKGIVFLGPIYDMTVVNNLRFFSNLYFHGHTVGGTNPSLLEAMASGALIAAHKNDFNASVLESEAYYFSIAREVSGLIDTVKKNAFEQDKIARNTGKINSLYSWQYIIAQYEKMFLKVMKGTPGKD